MMTWKEVIDSGWWEVEGFVLKEVSEMVAGLGILFGLLVGVAMIPLLEDSEHQRGQLALVKASYGSL